METGNILCVVKQVLLMLVKTSACLPATISFNKKAWECIFII